MADNSAGTLYIDHDDRDDIYAGLVPEKKDEGILSSVAGWLGVSDKKTPGKLYVDHDVSSQESTSSPEVNSAVDIYEGLAPTEARDGAFMRGVHNAKSSASITTALASGDYGTVADLISKDDRYQKENPSSPESQKLMAAWKKGDRPAPVGDESALDQIVRTGSSIGTGISNVAGQFADDWQAAPSTWKAIKATGANADALREGVVGQLPNMVLPMAGTLAGGLAGSAAGSAVPVIGTTIGGLAGAFTGSTVGNALVEGGQKVKDALQEAGIDPSNTAAVTKFVEENRGDILLKTGIKGATVGAVDTLTLKLGHLLLAGPAQKAADRAITSMGVDLADKAAVNAAKQTPEFAAKIAADTAYQATTSGVSSAARKGGAAALEPVGEGVGELVGEGLATGKWDAKEAALEAASSIGQGAATHVGQRAYVAARSPLKAKGGAQSAGNDVPADKPAMVTSTDPVSGDTVSYPVEAAVPEATAPEAATVDTAAPTVEPAVAPAEPAAPAAAPENAAPIEPAPPAGPIVETKAEQALKPEALDSLDRANAIQDEIGRIDERQAELAPENGYGPVFDMERDDLAAQHAALMLERQTLTKDWPKMATGGDTSFSTEAGARIDGKYALVESGDLVTSHDENLRVNPKFPPSLQPRDRERASSEVQVQNIVGKFNPARLAASPESSNGSPIIGADGNVESGNGRTIAIKRIYQANGQKAADYRQYLKDNADQFGLTPEQIDGMDKPVLVRLRTTPVDRAEFARQSNAPGVAQMSPSEQARSDVSRIEAMDDLKPDDNGDFSNAASRPFIRRFMEKLPTTEQSGLVDANGALSTAGYARVRNAVLAKAYGDSPVLVRMTESMDDNLRNISKALVMAAPKVAQVRDGISKGLLYDADPTADVLAAVEELSRLKESGTSVHDALAQTGMFGEQYSDETRAMLKFLDDNIRRPKRIAEFFNAYADALTAAGNPNQGSLLGGTQAPAKQALVSAAVASTEKESHAQKNDGQREIFGGTTENSGPTGQEGQAKPSAAQSDGTSAQSDVAKERVASKRKPAPKAKPAAPKPASADQTKVAKPESPAKPKIEDFGQKIEGARKDYAQAYHEQMQEAEKVDISAVPLSKSWPVPDYDKLLNDGAAPWAVGFARAARDAIPPKPRVGYKAKAWAQKVKGLRDMANEALSNQTTGIKVMAGIEQSQSLSESIGFQAQMYAELGHAKSLSGLSLSAHSYGLYAGVKFDPPKTLWVVSRASGSSSMGNWPSELAVGDTRQAAMAAFKKAYARLGSEKQKKQGVSFSIYSYRGKPGWYVGKKVGKSHIDLKRFGDVKAARDYLQNNHDDLVKQLEKEKFIPNERRDENSPRIGVDHRANLSQLNAVVQGVMDRSNVAADSLSDALIAHSGGSKLPSFIDVPFESMLTPSSPSDVDILLNQLPSYRLSVFTKFLGNLANTNALTVKGYSGLDIPGKRLVQSAMLNIGHNKQIVRRVIELVPVNVMNDLIGTKFSAEGLFSNKPMLSDGLAISREVSVRSANPSVLAFINAVANVTAKVPFALDVSRVSLKHDPAINAGQLDSILSQSPRHSNDVTPEDFADAFSFSGVQFGNYVSNERRQQDLNEAYDALMDMAGILEIPPRAISLNGELGLAFGARGSGGKNPASAHYEPGQIVMNLTKNRGAGSLAHEWWHALDNYFSRADSNATGMTTESNNVELIARGQKPFVATKTRPVMLNAYGTVVRAVQNNGMIERSRALDKRRTKAYWSTTPEMTARAFESYVINKLQDQGQANDYLANIVPESEWTLENTYPYPTAGEIKGVRAAFDSFFGAIQSRETESGIALESRDFAAGRGIDVERAQRMVDRVTAKMPGASDVTIRVVKNRLDVGDIEGHLPSIGSEGIYFPSSKDASGAAVPARIYLMANTLSTMARAEQVLAHELVGHFGMEALLGDKFSSVLSDVVRLTKLPAGVKIGSQRAGDPYYATMDAVKVDYPDYSPANQAREVLARMAETNVKPGFLERVYTYIRKFFRSLGINSALTVEEIKGMVIDSAKQLRSTSGTQSVASALSAAESLRAAEARNKPASESRTATADDTDKTTRSAEQEKWLATEAKARGYKSIDDLADKNYPLFEKLGALWAEKQKVVVTPAVRAEAIINKRVKVFKPLDTVLHKVTKILPIEKATSAIYDKAGFFLDRYTHENVKAAIVSNYGIPEAVLDQRALLQGRQRVQLRQAGHLIEKLATLTRAESRVAYNWMNEADPKAIDELMAQLPPESVAVLDEVRQMIDKLSRQAVALGQLDQRSYERNKFAYLRRSYEKHTLGLSDKEKAGRSRVVSILGEQYKGRGLVDDATMAQMKTAAPDWWRRKTQGSKADASLIGNTFIRFERHAPSGETTIPLDGIRDRPRGKLLEVAYFPTGEAVPAKFTTDWDQAGTYTVRDVKGDSVVLWRDFTKQEREKMGEIEEARFAIAKTLHGMIHDVEVGRYLEWLAKTQAAKVNQEIDPAKIVSASERLRNIFTADSWVRVPESKIEGTQVSKYGALAGRLVPGPIWNDVRQLANGPHKPLGDVYAKVLTLWKTSKTALSPTVHMNNVMSNVVMADWHDVSAGHVAKALRILLAANDRTGKGVIGRTGNLASRAGGGIDRAAAQEIVNRYLDSGGNIGTWATEEIARDQINPLLDALEQEVAANGETEHTQIGVYSALQHALHGRLGTAYEALKKSRAVSVPGKVVGTEAKNLIALYQSEDDVFRLATWLKSKEDGKSDLDSGKEARRSFLDYQINAPWIAALRSSAFPFISYTYRAVPMVLEIAGKKPHKLMKLMLVAGAINALGALLSGGNDDDERKLLPDEKAGNVWGMVPKLIRMPWNDGNQSPVYLDIRRWIPVGDFFDMGQGHAVVPILPVLQIGGPLALIVELYANKSSFTGQPITQETDTAAQKATKTMDYLYKAFAPNILGLPGTYATTAVSDAIKGKTDAFGREQSVAQATASSFGVKLGSYPRDVLLRNLRSRTDAQIREIDINMSRLDRQRSINKISQDEYAAAIKTERAKRDAVNKVYREKVGN